MKRNTLLVASVAAASMLFAAPAMAKEFKTADGNITIELPSDDWHEVIDPEAEFVFTNGMDIISATKYAPDEKVEIARNDEYYHAVLQLSYAYSDQLIVLTAQVDDATHLTDIYNSITSIKFRGISENNEVSEVKKDVNNYSTSDTDFTMYINSPEGLNLRESFSVNSAILTTIPHGSSVHVTGVVKLNGEDIGWDRVEYDGMAGYVSSANLVDQQVQVTDTGRTFEEIANKVLYYDYMYYADGTQLKVAYLNDGTILDMNGHEVVGFADGACQMYDGTIVYEFDPTVMSVDDWLNGKSEAAIYDENRRDITTSLTLYYEDGAPQTFGVLSDGYTIVTYDGERLTEIDQGCWQTPDGRLVYVYNPTVSNAPADDNNDNVRYLTSPAGDTGVEIHQAEDGCWYDNEGNAYWMNEAGIWYNLTNYTEWY